MTLRRRRLLTTLAPHVSVFDTRNETIFKHTWLCFISLSKTACSTPHAQQTWPRTDHAAVRQNVLSHCTTKQTKWPLRQMKDQPWHSPSLIRVFAVRMKTLWTRSYPLNAQRRFWSDRADAQADLILCWALSFCLFCHAVCSFQLLYYILTICISPWSCWLCMYIFIASRIISFHLRDLTLIVSKLRKNPMTTVLSLS